MAGIWYRTGSVAVTQSSKKITGTGTSWLTALNRPSKGNVFYGPDGKAYEIDYISSETEMYLVDIYTGANASSQSYKIDVRGGTVPELSRQLSEHYAYMQGIIDSLQSIVSGSGDVTITGPSGQTVTVPALANMLSKSGNLAGLADKRSSRVNLGLTAGPGVSADEDINLPSRLMRWMNYGTGHTIFDASSGISPSGGAIDRSNAHVPWAPDKPSLMGWNGLDTYGVRVDSARVADSVANLATAQIQPRSRTVTTGEAPHWYLLGRFAPSSFDTSGTLHVRGYVGPWTGEKWHIDLTFKNREGVSVSGYGTGLIDIRVQDLGLGFHEVWVYMPTYYVAELEVFAAGGGLTGWLFGDVVTDMPNGTTVWAGSQSMPVMLTSKDRASGTFAPTLFGSSAAGAPVYTNQSGGFYRNGKNVTFTLTVAVSSLVGADGTLLIGGMPFINGSGTDSAVSISAYNGLAPSVSIIGAAVRAGQSDIHLTKKNGSSSDAVTVLCSDFPSGRIIQIAGSYIIA